MRKWLAFASAACLLASPALSQDERGPKVRQPRAPGIEASDYVWNDPANEPPEALELKGDIVRGSRIYKEFCVECHLKNGAGEGDGSFPQLAGQHPSVVIKQIVDILEGRRDNPLMYPYARPLADPQRLSDVALYLSVLAPPESNGRGSGGDLERGRELYYRDCVHCHGPSGEGDSKNFYPRLAAQHYGYLLRQLDNLASTTRRNAHPEMVQAVAEYTGRDFEAVADFLSRLEHPSRKE